MPSPAAPGVVPFRLQPFPTEPAPADLTISGDACRDAERLTLRFALNGLPPQLRIPDVSAAPQRRDDLWQSTCLECFLAIPDDPGYWELNVCPSGDWNLYRLDAYRQGLRPDPATATPQLQRRPEPGGMQLAISLALPPPLAAARNLDVGLTAVIATRQGELSYWALCHPGPEADFHLRAGFRLRL